MITKEQAKELRRLGENRRKAEAYTYECDKYYMEDAIEDLHLASEALEGYLESITEE